MREGITFNWLAATIGERGSDLIEDFAMLFVDRR